MPFIKFIRTIYDHYVVLTVERSETNFSTSGKRPTSRHPVQVCIWTSGSDRRTGGPRGYQVRQGQIPILRGDDVPRQGSESSHRGNQCSWKCQCGSSFLQPCQDFQPTGGFLIWFIFVKLITFLLTFMPLALILLIALLHCYLAKI